MKAIVGSPVGKRRERGPVRALEDASKVDPRGDIVDNRNRGSVAPGGPSRGARQSAPGGPSPRPQPREVARGDRARRAGGGRSRRRGRAHRPPVQPRRRGEHPQGPGGGPLPAARGGADRRARPRRGLPEQHPLQGPRGDRGVAARQRPDDRALALQVRAARGDGVRGLRPPVPVLRLRVAPARDAGAGGAGPPRQARAEGDRRARLLGQWLQGVLREPAAPRPRRLPRAARAGAALRRARGADARARGAAPDPRLLRRHRRAPGRGGGRGGEPGLEPLDPADARGPAPRHAHRARLPRLRGRREQAVLGRTPSGRARPAHARDGGGDRAREPDRAGEERGGPRAAAGGRHDRDPRPDAGGAARAEARARPGPRPGGGARRPRAPKGRLPRRRVRPRSPVIPSPLDPSGARRASAHDWQWYAARGAVALFVVALLGLLWVLHRQELDEGRSAVTRDILWVEQNVRFALDRDADQLLALAADADDAAPPARERFELRAGYLLQNGPGLLRVLVVDSAGAVLASAPAPLDAGGAAVDPESEPARQLALRTGAPAYGPVVRTAQGNVFLAFVPYSRDGRIAGTVVGVYGLQSMISAIVPWWLAEKHLVTVRDASGAVLAAKSRVEGTRPELAHEVPLDPPGHGLVLHLESYGGGSKLLRNVLTAAILTLALAVLWNVWALRRHVRRRLATEEALRTEHAFRKAMEDSLR